MPDIVGIRFKSCGRIYDFEVDGLEVKRGDVVIVESELGLSIGHVVIERHPLTREIKDLKRVLRKATDDDLRQRTDNESLAAEAMAYCNERIMARGLPMKLVFTEVLLDRKRFIFYFTAEGRIDFRELVKDLAARYKTRIEMRQIGVRDEAKIIGGLGICGRELCCKKFLTSFEPISIKMAKSQELVLNASKLSGVCGRLMCCLSYEYGDSDKSAPETRDHGMAVKAEEEAEELADIADASPQPMAAEISSDRRSDAPSIKDSGLTVRSGDRPSIPGQSGAHESDTGSPSQPRTADRTERPVEAQQGPGTGEQPDKRSRRRRRRRRRGHR